MRSKRNVQQTEERTYKISRKRYSNEFKTAALFRAGEVGLKCAADELGIRYNTICKWKTENRKTGAFSYSKDVNETISRIKADNNSLREENLRLTERLNYLMEHRIFTMSGFYPEGLIVTEQSAVNGILNITLKSKAKKAVCPHCGKMSDDYHGSFRRHLQDIPLFGYPVSLTVICNRYNCTNPECKTKCFTEDLNGFAKPSRHRTCRLDDLISILGLYMSAETCSLVCSEMGITITGQSIINLLREKYAKLDVPVGDAVGIDDFAYRKGGKYCTVVVDLETQRVVTILKGRESEDIKEWLENHPEIKVVARDRATAYATAIKETLPNAIQVADRFHLYENLRNAVKETLQKEFPTKILLNDDGIPTELENEVKKTLCSQRK